MRWSTCIDGWVGMRTSNVVTERLKKSELVKANTLECCKVHSGVLQNQSFAL